MVKLTQLARILHPFPTLLQIINNTAIQLKWKYSYNQYNNNQPMFNNLEASSLQAVVILDTVAITITITITLKMQQCFHLSFSLI